MNMNQIAIQEAMVNEDLKEVYFLFRSLCALLDHEARRSDDHARQEKLLRIRRRLEIRVWFDLLFDDDTYSQL